MSQLPQSKTRYTVIGRIKLSHDRLGLGIDPRVQKMLKKLGYEDEKIIFSRDVQKCDTGKAKANPKWSNRILMLTNKALYNLRGENTCRRRTPLESIAALTLSTQSNQLVIHVPTKYDYLYNTYDSNLAAKLIKDAFDELGLEKGTEIELPLRRVMKADLRDLVITRKERKELTTEENLKNFNDLRRVSDTQEAMGEKPLQFVPHPDDSSGTSFMERCRTWLPQANLGNRSKRAESLRVVKTSKKAIRVSERRSLKKRTRTSRSKPQSFKPDMRNRISLSEPKPPSFFDAAPPMKELWDIRPSKHRHMLGVHKDQLHPMRKESVKKVSESGSSTPFHRSNDYGLFSTKEVLAQVFENKEEESTIKTDKEDWSTIKTDKEEESNIKTEYINLEKDNSFKAYQLYLKSVQSSESRRFDRKTETSSSTSPKRRAEDRKRASIPSKGDEELLSKSDEELLSTSDESESYSEEGMLELKEQADTDRAFRLASQAKWSCRKISQLRREMLEQLTKIQQPKEQVSILKKT